MIFRVMRHELIGWHIRLRSSKTSIAHQHSLTCAFLTMYSLDLAISITLGRGNKLYSVSIHCLCSQI